MVSVSPPPPGPAARPVQWPQRPWGPGGPVSMGSVLQRPCLLCKLLPADRGQPGCDRPLLGFPSSHWSSLVPHFAVEGAQARSDSGVTLQGRVLSGFGFSPRLFLDSHLSRRVRGCRNAPVPAAAGIKKPLKSGENTLKRKIAHQVSFRQQQDRGRGDGRGPRSCRLACPPPGRTFLRSAGAQTGSTFRSGL